MEAQQKQEERNMMFFPRFMEKQREEEAEEIENDRKLLLELRKLFAGKR